MTEEPQVTGRGALELLSGVLRPPERLSRTPRVGMRPKVNVAVAQQGQDRVIERRCGDFDLTALGSRPVLGDGFPEQFQFHCPQHALIVLSKAAAFGDKTLDAFILIQVEGIDPRQLVPDLQVA